MHFRLHMIIYCATIVVKGSHTRQHGDSIYFFIRALYYADLDEVEMEKLIEKLETLTDPRILAPNSL